MIVVPANSRGTEPLPPLARATFLERLSGLLSAAYGVEHDGAAGSAPEPPTPALSAHDANVISTLGNACATCRGECCTAGGTHAFLRGENLTRLRQAHPAESAETMLAEYAAYLPVRHYRDSCVYHTTSGCALPRTLRADLCNRYVCGGLTQLKTALSVSGETTAYIGAADAVQLRRLAVVNSAGARQIALGAPWGEHRGEGTE